MRPPQSPEDDEAADATSLNELTQKDGLVCALLVLLLGRNGFLSVRESATPWGEEGGWKGGWEGWWSRVVAKNVTFFGSSAVASPKVSWAHSLIGASGGGVFECCCHGPSLRPLAYLGQFSHGGCIHMMLAAAADIDHKTDFI